MLEKLESLKVDTTVDDIIGQIRSLITSGQLNPGDRLPSERVLAEQFSVGRSYIRDAIRKLEFYGILRTLPQSGTVVSGIGIAALEGLITDVLKIEETDFTSLVETRVILDVQSACLAAERRTEDDIVLIKNALQQCEIKLKKVGTATEEDLLFHLKIAEASKNNVLKSLMLIITPDILKSYDKLSVCNKDTVEKTIKDHQIILNHIIEKDVSGVEKAMTNHLSDVTQFSKKL